MSQEKRRLPEDINPIQKKPDDNEPIPDPAVAQIKVWLDNLSVAHTRLINGVASNMTDQEAEQLAVLAEQLEEVVKKIERLLDNVGLSDGE